MTTPPNHWGDEQRNLSHQPEMRGQILGRRQARLLSRRFARVGVETPPTRLRELLSGASAADQELTDLNFALIATRLRREQRIAKFVRLRRRATRLLICIGAILVALNLLVCLAYSIFSLTQYSLPS